MTENLFDGQRRTARRIVLLLACLAPFGWAMFYAVFRNVPGQDWVVFHEAARLARIGDFHTLADPLAFTDLLNWTHRAWFAKPLVFHPWVYPPVTLLLALTFGWPSYPASLAMFLSFSLAALLAALWTWAGHARSRAWLCAGVLLCPATAYILGAGQLSFGLAAVILAGVAWLPSAPVSAGALFSLLLLKPQFALMVPVALLAGRHWRAIAGGLAGSAWLIACSLAATGLRPWTAWLRLATGTDPALPGLVGAVRLYDQSVHTCLRTLGAPESLASAGQAAAMVFSALCVWRVFARDGDWPQRLCVLLCATVLASPHVGDYDALLPAIAAILVLLDAGVRRWLPGEPWIAAAVWLATMLAPPALVAALGVPAFTAVSALTPLATAGLMVMSTRPRLA